DPQPVAARARKGEDALDAARARRGYGGGVVRSPGAREGEASEPEQAGRRALDRGQLAARPGQARESQHLPAAWYRHRIERRPEREMLLYRGQRGFGSMPTPVDDDA